METRVIEQITVGDRHRKDLGDIRSLADSVKTVGLLHPVVVTPEGVLVAGGRRLQAVQLLGWTEVPVTVVDLADVTRGEHDENVMRQDFRPSEAVAIAKALEPVERAAAKERHIEQAKVNLGIADTANLAASGKGETRDNVAAYTGIGRTSLAKAAAVVEAAEREPERFAPLVEEMDRTGKVDGAFRALKREQRKGQYLQRKQDAGNVSGTYRVIYADPPWQYNDSGLDEYGHAERHYDTMSIDELCELPVSGIAEDDAVLFLWATSPLLEDAFRVIKAGDFAYKTSFVWDKVKHNFGHYNSVRHEFLVVATRGSCLPDNNRLYDSVVSIERTDKHSEKPDQFRRMIDDLHPNGPRIELFARTAPEGWSVWGDEADAKVG